MSCSYMIISKIRFGFFWTYWNSWYKWSYEPMATDWVMCLFWWALGEHPGPSLPMTWQSPFQSLFLCLSPTHEIVHRSLISALWSIWSFWSRWRASTLKSSFPLSWKYAYKAEPYVASEYKTVHEELTKSMTTILKPSADFLTSNKLLKVCQEPVWLFVIETD